MKKKCSLLSLESVEIAVERKPIKNMYLRVQPDGRVLLTAPRRTPDHVIERFARSRLPWLTKRLQACVPASSQRYMDGETVPVWGELYILRVIPGGQRTRVEVSDGVVQLRMPEGSVPEDRKRALDGWYRKALQAAIQELAPMCERIVGKRASQWRIRDMKTRWGSCNTNSAAITVNLQLARRAPLYLRYVMLHELTHLLEPTHNARFYALMDGFCPGWKQVRKSLKESVV